MLFLFLRYIIYDLPFFILFFKHSTVISLAGVIESENILGLFWGLLLKVCLNHTL